MFCFVYVPPCPNDLLLPWSPVSAFSVFDGMCGRVRVCVCTVAQSGLTLCDPMDCSPPGFSVHGIFHAQILEQVAISSSRGPSQPRD